MNNHVEIARLVSVCGKIEGRVKFQKIVYILQQLGHPFEEEFGYLHHGPYSSELKREIDQIVEWNLVSEQEHPAGEYVQYDYEAASQLGDVLKQLQREEKPDWNDLAKSLNEKESRDLEAISTVMFLQKKDFAGEKLRLRFAELKPHLGDRFDAASEAAVKLRSESSVDQSMTA